MGECANIAFPCKVNSDCAKKHIPFYSTYVKCMPNQRNAYVRQPLKLGVLDGRLVSF